MYVVMLKATFCFSADADFTAISVERSFSSGAAIGSSACVFISITDDGILEGSEVFIVNLLSIDSDVNIVAPNTTTVTIIDDELSK